MTNTLAVEYVGSGVTFTVLCPFTTRTAFIDTPNTRGIVEKMPGFMIQSPEAVARIGLEAVEKGKVVAHTSALNHAKAVALTVMPPRMITAGICRFMALDPHCCPRFFSMVSVIYLQVFHTASHHTDRTGLCLGNG